MFKKNIKPILMAGALALATAVSPVLADENPDAVTPSPSSNTIDVTKNLNFAKGISTINETYTYTVTPKSYYTYTITKDGVSEPGDLTVCNENNKSIFPTAAYDNKLNVVVDSDNPGSQVTNTNYMNATTKQTITFTAKANTIPGVYIYEVKETAVSKNEQNGTSSKDSKEWNVYVKVTDNEGIQVSEIKAKGSDAKVENIEFTNEYAENSSLTLTKEVEGLGGDKTAKFNFTIKLTLPEKLAGKTINSITASVGESEYTFNFEDVQTTEGEKTVTKKVATVQNIKLSDNQTITINGLPAGTEYEITEAEADKYGYTTTVDGADQLKDNTDVATGIVNDDEAEEITYTNDKDGAINTGVIVNNMPYIALLGASGAGLVVLAASKKRSKK